MHLKRLICVAEERAGFPSTARKLASLGLLSHIRVMSRIYTQQA
jgi:hypothetical protein